MNIRELKGIGGKIEELFHKLNVYTTEDLMKFYPRSYDVYDGPVLIKDMTEEKIYTFEGIVSSSCELNTASRYKVLSVMISDEEGERIRATWFNMPFLKNQLKRGYRYVFRGKVAYKGSLVFMEQPAMYSRDEYQVKLNSMQPIYGLTAGLTNNQVMKAVKQCIELGMAGKEYLPPNILQDNDLIPLDEAFRKIHFPKDTGELAAARKRIVFDEFLLFTLAVRSRKNANLLAENTINIQKSPYSARILANIGYELTNAQKKVYEEISSDMSSNHVMNRLVQGDVGSGKTIVAFLAMADVCYGGYQAVLMAPTEVLARQHYASLVSIIRASGLDIQCVLLTGSLTASAKRQAYEEIESGRADIVIGTHAVITDKVEFGNLGLVITDEQHRFGVLQREKLHKKGDNPHILVMSATPIPRSLAIILYGDLDISVIDEKPADRLPIKNCVVDTGYRENAYKFIQKELDKGHQAYIICAMAKENEDTEEKSIENVKEYAEKLRKRFGPEVPIECLNGKMKPSEKNRIMSDFEQGDIKILVSTTVVEVGINIPNATVMMVENAERFGLAGLHQLRGRVGRGQAQSYCIFVSDSRNPVTKERLQILKESNDGFYVAEQDLKLRGPGDILGVRQSGDFNFALADVYIDAPTLKLASDTAGKLLSIDDLTEQDEYAGLRDRLSEYMNKGLCNLNI
ncbi:MAG: ATP-dependent DNA helicase RecG [Butyrivibrio sp.]